MKVHDEEFLRYYWEELQYLRRMGSRFAHSHPKVAGRLELEADICPDPHVERLIEAFAFLTGRIQHNLDNDFPEIASELLGILHPHYLDPIPSLTIARFEVDPDRGKLTSGFEVAKHTRLFARAESGQVCRFRTCYPTELWPLEVQDASFESPDLFDFLDDSPQVDTVLRLRLSAPSDSLDELEVDRLRFHLAGDRILTGMLYELIFNHALDVAVLPEGSQSPQLLGAGAIHPVGFGLDDEILPYPSHSQPAYRLLQEYFVFPEKFHFFDIAGLAGDGERKGLAGHGEIARFDLLLLLDRNPKPRLTVGAENFQLGCTPVVNLFERTTEPVRVDHRKLHYRLVPDRRREKITEIHSLLSVYGSFEDGQTREFAPFYAFNHDMDEKRQRTFWHARRIPSLHQGVSGTEVQLAFLDLDFKPGQPPAETVFARSLCTNRALAEQLPAGAQLEAEEAIPARLIACLKKPTQQLSPPRSGQNLWRLISHLSLNYLTLEEGEDSLKALREILRLYSYSDTSHTHHQINGIREFEQKRVVRRLGPEAWRGFLRGTEITLTFDESVYAGSSAFLFASVLNYYLALYASTNSFTQLRIRSMQREGEWKRWPPMAGAKVVP